jgi:hypothetical protein
MFYVFVNDFARTVGEEPSESLLLGWLVDEGTKLNGLGGVTFGVLLILFARFVPFGAVGTAKIWRSKVVQVVPKLPIAMAGSKGSGTPQVSMSTVDSADASPDSGDASAP